MIIQEVIPDFFSEDYHKIALRAVDDVDGMALPDCLARRSIDGMFRDIFEQEMQCRSEALVEQVRRYMQQVLAELSETVCASCPKPLKTKIDDMAVAFLSEAELRCKDAISNLCQAELTWIFSLDPSYMKKVQAISRKIDEAVNEEEDDGADRQSSDSEDESKRKERSDLEVPSDFIQKAAFALDDDDIKLRSVLDVQVRCDSVVLA